MDDFNFMTAQNLRGIFKHALLSLLIVAWMTPAVRAQPAGAPTLGPASAADLSPALERSLGEAIMEQGRRDPDYIHDSDVAQYLNHMARKLAAHAPGGVPNIEAFGVRDASINAFALPGGFIGVHTGLIVSAESQAELAGVLAHEIAHVTQRHIARGLTQQSQSSHIALASIAAALLAAVVPGASNLSVGLAAFGQAAAIEQQLGFSRDAEQEADRTGFEMLRKAGYDPNGMAVMFGRLMKVANLNEGRGGGVYATTHPLSIQRMTDMQNRIRQLPVTRDQGSDEFWFVRARARVLQSVDPKALNQAIDVMEEDAQVAARTGGAASHVRQAASWYGVSLAYAARQDLTQSAKAFSRAQGLMSNSPYIELQKVDMALANKNPADAYTAALAGHQRWPDRRSFALRAGQSLQLMGKDREAIIFLKAQVKRWPSDEPVFFQMMAISQERLGDQVAARQEMARYYTLVGALPAAVIQLQQARSLTNDFYLQSQIDVEVREITQKIARDRRLLEKFR